MTSRADASVFTSIAERLAGRLRAHRPLTGGVSAQVEALELELSEGRVQNVVFRQPGAAEWKTGSIDTARREHDLLAFLHARGLPVPRPLLLDLSCTLVPRGYFVMEFIDGTPEVTDVADAVVRMADLLAEVHHLTLEGAPSLPEREDPIAGLLEFLPAEHDALRAGLLSRPPALGTRRNLLHGDYWPANLLWRGSELVGVLDWEDAAIGDPLSDVACCRLELRYKHGAEAPQRFTERYAHSTRCELGELAVWDAYVAAAALAFMRQWGLPAAREAHMRSVAQASLRAAADAMLSR